VRRADLRDVHLQAGMLADEHARRPRVVEMDVAEQEMADVLEVEPVPAEPLLQRADRRRRAAVE
jgi:hypothetical protein